jgi:four helix bundle protein
MGYKFLRTWQQAQEIFELTEDFVQTLPKFHPQTGQKMADVADHMLRSGRSQVRNIEEGYARTTTQEYVSFLGFTAGSLEELLRDYQYCVDGNLGDQETVNKGVWLCRGAI